MVNISELHKPSPKEIVPRIIRNLFRGYVNIDLARRVLSESQPRDEAIEPFAQYVFQQQEATRIEETEQTKDANWKLGKELWAYSLFPPRKTRRTKQENEIRQGSIGQQIETQLQTNTPTLAELLPVVYEDNVDLPTAGIVFAAKNGHNGA